MNNQMSKQVMSKQQTTIGNSELEANDPPVLVGQMTA